MTSATGRWLVRAGAALAVASLGLTVDNLRRIRTPSPSPDVADPDDVVLLLPVRDEAGRVVDAVQELVVAARHWPGRARVVVLDDASSDGTTTLLAELAGRADLRDVLEVVPGTPTPPGWLGKPWACHQLAGAAGGAGVLVFVDADVALTADGLTATVDLLRSSGLDLVCPYPHQEARGPAERLVQPLLQWSWMSTLPLGLAERSPRPSLTAANGQLLAVDAAAYRRAGGHAAVRDQVLEDIALLRAVKASGGHGVVADGSRVASCRMYDGWADLRQGYAKSLWSAFGTPAGAAGVTALMVLTHVVPALAALRGSRTGLAGYAASVAARALVARRTGSRVLPDAAAHPLSVALLGALTADSVLAHRRGTLRWKGRPVEVSR
ncbi:glycosyltransferase [Nocardioides dongxiaopingii]|uniref:glycosyltransferase n=1 Tax=Nocardioides sp. S-1144 TaxID=2582905 RepID=UPI00110EFFFE|nr:glycosyltransferase family 2 protein [Nocardioides sp. S-1144]QCW51594.1 glycosyltransferase [Nocardioides sp. S-1144]